MNCPEIKELLSAYIDNMLEPAEKSAVETHCASCAECAKDLAELKAVIAHLASLEKIEAPADFAQKVHERIERKSEFEKIVKNIFTPKLKLPLEVVGVLTSVVLVITVYRFMHPAEQAYYSPMTEQPLEMAVPLHKSVSVKTNAADTKTLFSETLPAKRQEQRGGQILQDQTFGSITPAAKVPARNLKTRSYEMEETLGISGSAVMEKTPTSEAADRNEEQLTKSAQIILPEPKKDLPAVSLNIKEELIQTKVIPLLKIICSQTNARIIATERTASGETLMHVDIPTQNVARFINKLKFIAPSLNLEPKTVSSSQEITSVYIRINPR